ncbi:MAG: hypothetical protein ACRDZW_04005 [Acidimicrobiales bacterium]
MVDIAGRVGSTAVPTRRRRAVGRSLLASSLALALLIGPGAIAPAGANHRHQYGCSDVPHVAGTTLLRLNGLVIGSIRHLRSTRCRASMTNFSVTPAFREWAFRNGYQWFASTVVDVDGFAYGAPAFPYQGTVYYAPRYAYNPDDLWSVPVFDGPGSCFSSVGTLVVYRADRTHVFQNAVTPTVCD